MVKIVTPGTTTSTNLLNEKTNNYFISLAQIGKIYGLACVDLSTAEFFLLELESTSKLFDELHRLNPSELLLSKKFVKNNPDFCKNLSYELSFVLNEKEDFEVILIGLDGGIKLQRTKILTKEDLFKITDSMPMRRDELTRKKIKN